MKYLMIHAVDQDATPNDPTCATPEALDALGAGDAGARRPARRRAAATRCPTPPPCVPRDGSPVVTDGPFAETKEQVAGYDVIDCPDLDAAVAVAAAHPTTYLGSIEVRAFDEGMPDPVVPEQVPDGKLRYLMLVCADMRRAMAAASEPLRDRSRAVRADAATTSTRGPTRWTPGSSAAGPRRLYGWPLEFPSEAVTVRRVDGEVVTTDGPFAETKEQIAGYDLLECDDLDDALEVAAGASGRRRRCDRAPAALAGMTRRRRRGRPQLRRELGAARRGPDRLVRRLGPGRGVRPGGVRLGASSRGSATGCRTQPLGWLTTVARNRARDRIRRRTTEGAKLDLAHADSSDEVAPVDVEDIPDERLRLIFTCCHPALPMPARMALTLRTLCGLTAAEIARAFLVTEPTMEKRLVRARAKIKHAGIPYRVPPPELWAERVEGVLGVLYLMFNEGYAASSGESVLRVDVSAEAIRLTRSLVDLLPGEDEVRSLLALMLLTDARRPARVRDGRVVPLAEQDRSRWDRALHRRGCGAPRGPRRTVGSVRRAGPDLVVPRRRREGRRHRLGRDRPPLHPAAADARHRAEPCRRGLDDPRPGRGAGDGRGPRRRPGRLLPPRRHEGRPGGEARAPRRRRRVAPGRDRPRSRPAPSAGCCASGSTPCSATR